MSRIYTDSRGGYVELAKPPVSALTSEQATRDSLFDRIYEILPNPDPVLRRTAHRIDILHEIRRDAHVSACAKSRKAGVGKRKWKIDQGSASARAAELAESILRSLPLRRIMREILNAWGYGYQTLEVVWKREGNLLLPEQVIGKPQEWFVFDGDNHLRRRVKGNPHGEVVDQYKYLLATYEAEYNNPYGEAQYSLCFWPVTFKKGGLKFWAVFLEKFGMPHAVGKVPRAAKTKERRELLNALAKMVRDAVAVFPDDASVELLEKKGGSGNSDLYERYARYHDGEISKVLLGHGSAADSTPGRLGNETQALDVRGDIIDDDATLVEETLNTLIKWIHELNPSLGAETPAFELFEEEEVDEARSKRDERLLNTGYVKLNKTYFTKRYDFDDEDIEIVEPDAQPPTRAPQFAAPDGQTQVDRLGASITDNSTVHQRAAEALLKPVFDLLETANSLDEVNRRLPELFPEMDSEELQETLEKALLLAGARGRAEGSEE